MEKKTENNKRQLKIEIDENTKEEYVNFAIVSHSPAEFILDFIRLLPGLKKTKVKSRVILAPMHAKTLMLALSDNIRKFENKFGEIKIHKGNQGDFKLPKDMLPN